MRTARIVRALIVAGCCLFASVASAADPTPEDIAQARSLGEQGQAALDAKKFAEAEKLFSAATRLYPGPPTLPLGVARAQAGEGKLVVARETYRAIVREYGASTTLSPAFKAAVDAARTEGDALSSRIANVTIIVVDGPKDPKVTIDDVALSSAALGLPRPTDPGTHKIVVSAEGYKSAEATITVGEGGNAEQRIPLVKDGAIAPPPSSASASSSVAPPPPPTTSASTAPPEKSSRKTIGYVVGGVGLAGIVVGAVTGIIAIGDHDSLKKACNSDGKCPTTSKNDIDSYNTMGAISTVGFIVGAVGLGAGAALVLTAPKDPQAASVTPYIGLGQVGLTGRF